MGKERSIQPLATAGCRKNACLGIWKPSHASDTLCDLEQVTSPLWASVSSSSKKDQGGILDELQRFFQPCASLLVRAGSWDLDLSQYPMDPWDFLEARERPGQLLRGVAGP